MQYANKSLLENEKCTQFIQFFEKKIQISKMIVLHLYLNQIKLKIFQICQNTFNMIAKVIFKNLVMNNYKYLTF
jgi:phosphorylcholine metabolism protein LicD